MLFIRQFATMPGTSSSPSKLDEELGSGQPIRRTGRL
jgi:hypothetical protein